MQNWSIILRNIKRIQSPSLVVNANGKEVEERASEFRLSTDVDIPFSEASITYPKSTYPLHVGDELEVDIAYSATDSYRLFTGRIVEAYSESGKVVCRLSDGFVDLWNTRITAGYRKEKARIVIEDFLGESGITDYTIDIPDIELPRFSVQNLPASEAIRWVWKSLDSFLENNNTYRFYFDQEGLFHFDDPVAAAVDGETLSFTRGEDVIKSRRQHIEVLPVPVRHSHTIWVDDNPVVVHRTDTVIRRSRSRTFIYSTDLTGGMT